MTQDAAADSDVVTLWLSHLRCEPNKRINEWLTIAHRHLPQTHCSRRSFTVNTTRQINVVKAVSNPRESQDSRLIHLGPRSPPQAGPRYIQPRLHSQATDWQTPAIFDYNSLHSMPMMWPNNASSVMWRDDSWPATVPSVVPTGDCSHWSVHYIH